MKFINRGVVILKPKPPFVDWTNRTGDGNLVLTLGEIAGDSTAYLTPEIEGDQELREFLEQSHMILFEQELFEWSRDESEWPIDRDLDMFLEWFDIEFYSTVIDSVDEGIEIWE